MTREKTAIDKLIEPAIKEVAGRSPYFQKGEVVAQVLNHRQLGEKLEDIRKRYGVTWKFDEIIRRYIEGTVGRVLQARDENGIRIYECYAAGEQERRWMPIRAMTADTLRVVMRETRTQERHLHIKGEGYQFFLDELEKRGPTATVEEVYDKVIPLILQFRNQAGDGVVAAAS